MARAELPHIKAMSSRQFAPGSMLLLCIALWVFAPRAWDTVMGEPWIDNQLKMVLSSTGTVLIEDSTLTSAKVHGRRIIYLEAQDEETLCSTDHVDSWYGEHRRFWKFEALSRCSIPEQPFRICSGFLLTSEVSGRQRSLGPFCSGYQEPVTPGEINDANEPHHLAPHRRGA